MKKLIYTAFVICGMLTASCSDLLNLESKTDVTNNYLFTTPELSLIHISGKEIYRYRDLNQVPELFFSFPSDGEDILMNSLMVRQNQTVVVLSLIHICCTNERAIVFFCTAFDIFSATSIWV